jgi:hypothetical protein
LKVILFSGKATEGKDASANILKELLEQDGEKVLIVHYADLLKYICKTFFEWDGKKDDIGRNLLQKTGTDVIRKKMPNFWVQFVADILLMFPDDWNYCLIPDCRFPNEIKFMNNLLDTTAVRVTRLNYKSPLTEEQKNHISETALDNYQFDYYLDSESGLDKLRVEVEKMYEYIKLKDGANG